MYENNEEHERQICISMRLGRKVQTYTCSHCNNVFYKKEGLTEHKQKSTKCGDVCQSFFTSQSPEMKYCAAIGHQASLVLDQVVAGVYTMFVLS